MFRQHQGTSQSAAARTQVVWVLYVARDVIHLVHGPIGCAYWTWGGGTRQNLSDNPGFHRKYCFSTDMQEDDIIFGGEDKLYKSILEAHKEFPEAKGVFVYATCAIGLIGDDLNGVCKRAEQEIGIRVVPFNCEGFRGCSQSLGHHIANDTLFERVVGTKEPEYLTDFDMNIIGDYNIQGDLWEIKPLFERMGIRILSTFTGNASVDDIAQAHRAKLNLSDALSAVHAVYLQTDGGKIRDSCLEGVTVWNKTDLKGIERRCSIFRIGRQSRRDNRRRSVKSSAEN